jgi:hypothetical protein
MRLILSVLFMSFFFISYSQKSGNNEVWVEGRFKAGFLAAHRSSIGHLAVEHAYAGELSYLVQTKGQRDSVFWDCWKSRITRALFRRLRIY